MPSSRTLKDIFAMIKLSPAQELLVAAMDECSDELDYGCDYCTGAEVCAALWQRAAADDKLTMERLASYGKPFLAIKERRRENLTLAPCLERLREPDEPIICPKCGALLPADHECTWGHPRSGLHSGGDKPGCALDAEKESQK